MGSKLQDLSEASAGISLRPIFDELFSALTQPDHKDAHTLIIVDDLSTLEWIGFSASDVSHFARALCALSRKVGITIFESYLADDTLRHRRRTLR